MPSVHVREPSPRLEDELWALRAAAPRMKLPESSREEEDSNCSGSITCNKEVSAAARILAEGSRAVQPVV